MTPSVLHWLPVHQWITQKFCDLAARPNTHQKNFSKWHHRSETCSHEVQISLYLFLNANIFIHSSFHRTGKYTNWTQLKKVNNT